MRPDLATLAFMTRIANLSWDRIEPLLAAGAPAILPIGAGAKEHGLHLPMNADEVQALWLAGKLAEKTGALIWPAVTYGFYPAFTDFPGSISLSRATFVTLIREIVTGIKQHGARRCSCSTPASRRLLPSAKPSPGSKV
ncbi:MAG: creatininase family protein [Rhizobiales bacterium]|nr:creatininase family protein [Hyphomicrobiales bacterium]